MRVLLLMPTTTYRVDDFVVAADKLAVEVVLGSDRCHVLDELGAVATARDSLVLDFLDAPESARRIVAYAGGGEHRSLDAVVALDDPTTVIAALAADALGLPYNPVEAALASRDKLRMRERLAAAGVRQARYCDLPIDTAPAEAAARASLTPGFPCVVKPRCLSASRGVIRADDRASFEEAFARVVRILRDPEVAARGGDAARSVLVESFVPGREVAFEGLLTRGRLDVLALFDKPDPLDGPFFEETLYVTPSRLAAETQRAIADAAARAVEALGLCHGPVHAELRVNETGVHVVEVAARTIGGLCARTLRFGTGMSLEEIVLRHALAGRGPGATRPERSPGASGVLMLPIPRSGVFRGAVGLDEARAVSGVVDITITARVGRELVALPEGSAYLGFAFARATTPAEVEAALRAAHAKLRFEIVSSLPRTP